MNEYSIGVDLGGTNLRAAAVDRQGRILEKISVDTNFEGGRDAVIGDIVNSVNKLKRDTSTHRLAGVGIGWFDSLAHARDSWREDRQFRPGPADATVELKSRWRQALGKA